MAFLAQSDYLQVIQEDILTMVTENNPTNRLMAENSSMEQMKSYLCTRYDVTAIFAAHGNDRNGLIVQLLIDITLYHLHARIDPEMIPDIRRERYKNAIEWLKDVANEVVNPVGLPPLTAEDGSNESGFRRFGSNNSLISQW